MSGIPTMYRSVQFRSRVEARWAAMFDQLNWRWEYEPIDLDGYIPDFILSFPAPLLVEVKHELALPELTQHEEKIDASGWDQEAIIVGAAPVFADARTRTVDDVFPLGGLIRERDMDGWWWEAFRWHYCHHCKHVSVHHAEGSYRCRVAGCYDGNAYLGSIAPGPLRALWAAASNTTAWRPAA